jgi:hypothetical protein
MEEHWKVRDGNFLGLYALKSEHAKGLDKWERIDDIVRAYTQLHPTEVELTVRENQAQKKEQLNMWGATKDKSLRQGLAIPAGLLFAIEQVYPEVFSEKPELHKFMRKFQGFTVCETV